MQQTWQQRLKNRQQQMPGKISLQLEGRLVRMSGLALEAVGIKAAIGARCMVDTSDGEQIETEVVGFSGERLYLMPTVAIHGLLPNARVVPKAEVYQVEVGEHLLGRILDGRGMPLDDKPLIGPTQKRALYGQPLNPLSRNPIRQSLDVGIRAINALLTVGRGQRLGLFAGSGVGKSVLLGMMTRYTKADVVVVGLIGERGREVKEFVEDILGEQGLARAVVVAAPADTSPLMRLHGAMLTHSIAEHFRDNGKHVLLLMDSLTRFAQAQREVALAVGELPATKGYPPSVFARLPQLVERAGNGGRGSAGSITGFYTVLAEGDDQNDPIADAARAILDGHLVLSRQLAESGHYPAIDIEASISRTMPSIVSADHLHAVQTFRRLYSAYESNRDLINVGAYQAGSNAEIDLAIKMREPLLRFLAQSMYRAESILSSHQELLELIESCKEKAEKPPAVVANTNVAR